MPACLKPGGAFISFLFIVDPSPSIPNVPAMKEADKMEGSTHCAPKPRSRERHPRALRLRGRPQFKSSRSHRCRSPSPRRHPRGLSAIRNIRAERRRRQTREEVAEGTEKNEVAITAAARFDDRGAGAFHRAGAHGPHERNWRSGPHLSAIAATGVATFGAPRVGRGP